MNYYLGKNDKYLIRMRCTILLYLVLDIQSASSWDSL